MTFYFTYLFLYYFIIGVSRLIFNEKTINFIALAYLITLFILIAFKHSYKLLKINKCKLINRYMLLLLIPTANIASILITHQSYSSRSIIVMFVSPVIEELLFRVVIFELINRKAATKVLITNIIFSLMHILNFSSSFSFDAFAIQLTYSFLMGVAFSLILLDSNSIVIPIIYHILINVTSLEVYNNNKELFIMDLLIAVISVIWNLYYSKALKEKKNETIY